VEVSKARDHGVVQAARFAYFHRHWRPIAAPLLAVPFLAHTQGDTRAAFRLYSITFAAILAAAVFASLHAWLLHAGAAFAGTLVLMWTPWVLDDQLRLWSELPWLICTAGFLFGLARARMGICLLFLTGALLCRPLETAIGFFIPFGYLVVSGSASLRKVHLAFIAGEIAAVLAVAIKPDGTEYAFLAQAGITSIALLYVFVKLFLLYLFKPEALRPQFLWTFSWLLPFLWYLPGFGTLWDWIALSTWGPGTLRLNRTHHAGTWVLPLFFVNAGFLLWLPFLLVAVKWREVLRFWRARRPAFVLLGWAAFAMLTIGMFTVSRDFRYYQASWLVLFVGMAASLRAVFPARSVAAIFSCIALLQAAIVWPYYFRLPRLESLKHLGGDLSSSRVTESDADFESFNDFLRGLPFSRNATLIFSVERDREAVRLISNPWKHVLRARENGLFWRGSIFDNDWDGGNSAAELAGLAGRTGDVLVAGGPYPESQSRPAILSRAVFDCYGKGDCSVYGLKPVAAYRDGSGYEFRILEFEKAHYVPEAGKENLIRCFVAFQEFLGQK
jgi:hypothetical protein